jgi:hypothetical protein
MTLEQRQAFSQELSDFVVGLAEEGERSAVVLGAVRLDVALERLLTQVTRHHPGGADNLFDPERPPWHVLRKDRAGISARGSSIAR